MIVYCVIWLITIMVIYISNNESLVRSINVKLGLVPMSNIFKTSTPYLISLTLICMLDYIRRLMI